MQIGACGSGGACRADAAVLSGASTSATDVPVKPAADDATDPAPVPAPTAPPSRLLEKLAAGHFNPVAALRLAVNHAEQIKAGGLRLEEPAPAAHGRGYERALAAYRAMMASSGEKPEPIEPTPAEPAPSEPGPIDPTPVQPAPVDALA